ncbi:thioredoxin-related transmembrane protein 2 homolog [Artemia franciscana]|uniref:Thioredoxin domain-containing protein n=1 Tax=Artemia franciscana TaxID=6661 RepID=A0AA88I318_ARTSF|nr:hypothetical protein QYM36_004464 [Artemia franciscana]
MAWNWKSELKQVLKPYYVINIILSISFVFCKSVQPVCTYIFPEGDYQCQISTRESEILFFLLFVVMMRARKTGAMGLTSYLSNSFSYCKCANFALWFYTDPRMGLFYLVLFILQALLVPEPMYSGPSDVLYFRDNMLNEELEKDKKIMWFVCFYTVWSPSCVNFSTVFSKLSAEYALDNLKFGKIDVGRYPGVAQQYGIDTSSFSKQLPTLVMFKDGKEIGRAPKWDAKGKLVKFVLTEDNVKVAFDLNNIYSTCKKSLKKPKEVENRGHAKSE